MSGLMCYMCQCDTYNTTTTQRTVIRDKSNWCLKQFSTEGHWLVGNHGPTSGEIYGPGGDFPH